MKRHTFLSLTILGATLATSCTRSGAETQTAAVEDSTPVVAVAKAARGDLSSDLNLTAEFEPFQEVDLMAKVSGYVKEIKVDVGDRVREGQALATLEIPEMQDDMAKANAAIEEASSEIATARDELTRAQSAQEIAHLSFTRVLEVSRREPGLIPQQEVDEAHSRDLVAQAEVSSAKSKISVAEQRVRVAKTDQARVTTLRQYLVITAPFAGVITKRYANTGSLIQAGTASQTQAMPLVRLSENGLLRLILPVPESSVSMIHIGEPLDVEVSTIHRKFPGRVARFNDRVQQSTRTMETEVDVPNPSLVLIPGMYAEVNLRVEERRNVMVVPVDAVEGSGAAARVFVVQPAGTVHIVPVEVGLETAQRVEIKSGIAEGDDVVVGRRTGLREGLKVQAKRIDPPKS